MTADFATLGYGMKMGFVVVPHPDAGRISTAVMLAPPDVYRCRGPQARRHGGRRPQGSRSPPQPRVRRAPRSELTGPTRPRSPKTHAGPHGARRLSWSSLQRASPSRGRARAWLLDFLGALLLSLGEASGPLPDGAPCPPKPVHLLVLDTGRRERRRHGIPVADHRHVHRRGMC